MLGIGTLGQYALGQFPQTSGPAPPTPQIDPRFISASRPRTLASSSAPRRITTTPFTRSAVTSPKRRLQVTTPSPRILITTPWVKGMPQGNDFSPLDTVEDVNDTFNFGPWLPSGVTIASIVGVTCAVYSKSPVPDGAAASRLVGSPSIVASPSTNAPSAAVLQKVGNSPVAGAIYLLEATVTTSDGQQLNLFCHQTCQAPN